MIRTYTELSKLKTFKERFLYLKLDGGVGNETFGFERYLNQVFYKSREWIQARNEVILRDNGCDLGIEGHNIFGGIIIHHMNPITMTDIRLRNPDIYNPEFLICVKLSTHNAIHYSDESILAYEPTIREQNDTCPWRKND